MKKAIADCADANLCNNPVTVQTRHWTVTQSATFHSVASNVTHSQKPQSSVFAQVVQADYSNRFGLPHKKHVKTPRGGIDVKSNNSPAMPFISCRNVRFY